MSVGHEALVAKTYIPLYNKYGIHSLVAERRKAANAGINTTSIMKTCLNPSCLASIFLTLSTSGEETAFSVLILVVNESPCEFSI